MSVIYLLRYKLQTLPRTRCGCIYSTTWSLNLRWRTLDTQSCSGTVPPRRHQLPAEGPPGGRPTPGAMAALLHLRASAPTDVWGWPLKALAETGRLWWSAEHSSMLMESGMWKCELTPRFCLYFFAFQNKKCFWSTVDLQYHVGFRSTVQWSHFIYIKLLRFSSLLGYYKILSRVSCAISRSFESRVSQTFWYQDSLALYKNMKDPPKVLVYVSYIFDT